MSIHPILRKTALLFCFLLVSLLASGQILQPVKWTFSSEKLSGNQYELQFTVNIDAGWSIYGIELEAGGPIPTAIEFLEDAGYSTVGKLRYPAPQTKQDPNFNMKLSMFSGTVVFRQTVEVFSSSPVTIKGEVSFMSCDDTSCLPPDYIDFSFDLPGVAARSESPRQEIPDATSDKETSLSLQSAPAKAREQSVSAPPAVRDESVAIKAEKTVETVADSDPDSDTTSIQRADTLTQEKLPAGTAVLESIEDDTGLGWNFLKGFLGGLLALLTPCVFPMIPLTVSFFLRNASNQAKAVRDALMYGLTIVFAYVVLGMAIAMIFGADTLNALATSPGFNIFFFALLVFFAASFFGAFELTMPSSWSSALDEKADKSGGLIGVFLMGITFVLVSFSCTGPIVGTLLVEAATSGNILSPAVGMLGFSLALAVPFSLFALFPSALKSLPRSGGWMNSVKVVLGFIVLAFSMKFLAVADSVGRWGILDREIFLAVWIVLFLLLGLYLLGKIKFSHDSELKVMSVPRLMLTIASFSFMFYLIPGLWGAPLKGISSFLPSMTTQDFDLTRLSAPAIIPQGASQTYYVGESVKEGAHGLLAYTDYEEGLAAAKKYNKPVFLDFTGLGCANCRKMEASVWSNAEVQQRLGNDFIKIALYVDDRTPLPAEKQFVSTSMGRNRTIRTVGQQWSIFQAERFGVNTQPYYVILDPEGNAVSPGYGFNLDVQKFVNFLNAGKKSFQ